MTTRSGRFALLSSDFGFFFFFCQILSIKVKTFSNTNLQASRNILRGKGSLPAHFHRSKKSLLNLPIINSKLFWFLIVLLPVYLLFHNNAQNWMFSWHHPIKEKKILDVWGQFSNNRLLHSWRHTNPVTWCFKAFNTWRTPNSRKSKKGTQNMNYSKKKPIKVVKDRLIAFAAPPTDRPTPPPPQTTSKPSPPTPSTQPPKPPTGTGSPTAVPPTSSPAGATGMHINSTQQGDT